MTETKIIYEFFIVLAIFIGLLLIFVYLKRRELFHPLNLIDLCINCIAGSVAIYLCFESIYFGIFGEIPFGFSAIVSVPYIVTFGGIIFTISTFVIIFRKELVSYYDLKNPNSRLHALEKILRIVEGVAQLRTPFQLLC